MDRIYSLSLLHFFLNGCQCGFYKSVPNSTFARLPSIGVSVCVTCKHGGMVLNKIWILICCHLSFDPLTIKNKKEKLDFERI